MGVFEAGACWAGKREVGEGLVGAIFEVLSGSENRKLIVRGLNLINVLELEPLALASRRRHGLFSFSSFGDSPAFLAAAGTCGTA